MASSSAFTKLRHDSSREKYSSWKEPMLHLLESKNLLAFINGELPPQTNQDWKQIDHLIKDSILETLSDELIPAVINCTTSRDVWLQLEFMFTQSAASPPPPPPPPSDHQGGEEGYKWMPLALYNAALKGDWDATKEILERHSDATEARVLPNLDTALHIAVGTGKAIPYLLKLVNQMTDEELAAKNATGKSALHVAALMGNVAAARILVRRCPTLLYLPDNYGYFPVVKAAVSEHRPTVEFFIYETKDDFMAGARNPYAHDDGVFLLNSLIDAEFLDIALNLINKYPDLAKRKHTFGHSALGTIALKDAAFLSGTRFNFWERFIYSSIQLEMASQPQLSTPNADIEDPSCCTLTHREFGMWNGAVRNLNQVLMRIVPQAKWIHDQKLKHHHALKLLTCLCEHLESLTDTDASSIYTQAVVKASELGIHEVVEAIVQKFPVAVYSVEPSTHRYFFHIAAVNRCEKVFNLIYQMSDHKYQFSNLKDLSGNTLLHLVARLAPPHKLNLVSGAALQMQRELQWFKEMEKYVRPHERERANFDGKTPKMIFTEEHNNLKVEGERWMKDTANSCSIAAALIATVVFAAAITVPGGNAESGYPLFARSSAFIIFAISDALSLFTSSTSLLMFLSILTSRYAEEDFLRALPKRLCVGLFTLFLSILSMMAAFSTTIYLVFGRKNAWVLIPVAGFACLPVSSFVLLQFPLLVDVTASTYGRGIFGKQSERPFH